MNIIVTNIFLFAVHISVEFHPISHNAKRSKNILSLIHRENVIFHQSLTISRLEEFWFCWSKISKSIESLYLKKKVIYIAIVDHISFFV